MFGGNNQFNTKGKLVVISGGSQGCGAELAKQVFNQGANVIIIARTESKLIQTVAEIEKYRIVPNQSVKYISADISIYSECERVFNEIDIPDIVICCAGSSTLGLFTELSGDDLENGIKVNYNTAIFFAHAALKKMIPISPAPKEPRHIVFFSSVTAFYSFIGYGQYAPLKAAIRSLADLLRQEVLPYNIKVECIFPGNFMSEGFLEEEKTKPDITRIIEGPSTPISGENCAKIVLDALNKGYETVTTDTIGYILGSSMLGASPRYWGWLQVIIGFIFSLIAPIATLFVNKQIHDYFDKRAKKIEELPSSEQDSKTKKKD